MRESARAWGWLGWIFWMWVVVCGLRWCGLDAVEGGFRCRGGFPCNPSFGGEGGGEERESPSPRPSPREAGRGREVSAGCVVRGGIRRRLSVGVCRLRSPAQRGWIEEALASARASLGRMLKMMERQAGSLSHREEGDEETGWKPVPREGGGRGESGAPHPGPLPARRGEGGRYRRVVWFEGESDAGSVSASGGRKENDVSVRMGTPTRRVLHGRECTA